MASPWFGEIPALSRFVCRCTRDKPNIFCSKIVKITNSKATTCYKNKVKNCQPWFNDNCIFFRFSPESLNFAKSWWRHPFIIKKKRLKKFSFYLAQILNKQTFCSKCFKGKLWIVNTVDAVPKSALQLNPLYPTIIQWLQYWKSFWKKNINCIPLCIAICPSWLLSL